ncbi:MAG: RecX family transcriptional regulator [Anaerolineaceae bacterium]|jgi:regulatory protein
MNKRITALKAQKKNPNRINVYLDGEFAFGLTRLVAAWLNIGQELDDEQIARLERQDSGEVALENAVKFISYRSRTELEIRRRLSEKGFSDQEIDNALERLRSIGLVADEQYARSWVENRSASRPRSRRLMAIELHQKGVSDLDIEKALEETEDDDKLAYQAATHYARRLANLDWDKFRERLSAFLLRRGFAYGTIAPVVRCVWSEIQAVENPEQN